MPIISTTKTVMQQSIKQAFIRAKEDGSKDGASPDTIVQNLSTDIADAVEAYVTSCQIIINPGQVVQGTAIVGGMPGVAIGVTLTPGQS